MADSEEVSLKVNQSDPIDDQEYFRDRSGRRPAIGTVGNV